MTKKSFQSQSGKAGSAFWSLSHVHKAETLLYALLIFLLPTQLGKHFWLPSSFVLGIKIDYLSPTLYLTDCVVILLFLSACLTGNSVKLFTLLGRNAKRVLLGLIFFAALTGLRAQHPEIAFYGLLKLIEFLFVGLYTAFFAVKKISLQTLSLLLAIGVIVETMLATLQYFVQGSLGSAFYLLGERAFTAQTPGIALASLAGKLSLRPYGTFSHPNVLAGYLLLSLILITSIGKVGKGKGTFFFRSILAIGTLGLLVTLSRTAVILWAGYALVLLMKRRKERLKLLLVALVGFGILLFFTPLPLRFSSDMTESVSLRVSLLLAALRMVINAPLGVGLLHFLSSLPAYSLPLRTMFYIQPVHNIFLLTAAELGLPGLVLLLWFFQRTIQHVQRFIRKRLEYTFLLMAIVLLGMVDHYFFTLQQGQLLFSVVMGLLWAPRGKGVLQ